MSDTKLAYVRPPDRDAEREALKESLEQKLANEIAKANKTGRLQGSGFEKIAKPLEIPNQKEQQRAMLEDLHKTVGYGGAED